MSTTLKDASRVEVTPDMVGRTIDKYRVLGVVGKGGMGCVYEAINTVINKRVAMKCIDHSLALNEEANARFQREALAAGSIESPHIVQIFDAGETDDEIPYIVMELLRGQDLGAYIGAHGALSVEEAIVFVAQILKGLHHAHSAGIVHRDLKPDNVFLVEREDEPAFVKLLDFGVSKIARPNADVPLQTLTRQGTVVGTPFYMSPEQAQAYPDVDGRTDIYSAGAILYECLTGRPPHVGKSYEQVIVHICMHDAEDVRKLNPEVPDRLAKVVAKALSRERDERYADAKAMLAELVEQLPASAKTGTSSLLSGISLGGSSPELAAKRHTPRVISTPTGQDANELADTVMEGVDEEALRQSGARATGSELPLETVRSVDPNGPARRRGIVAIAVAASLGVGAYLLFSGGQPAPEQGEVPSAEAQAAVVAPPDTAPQATAEPELADTAKAEAAPAAETGPAAGTASPAAGTATKPPPATTHVTAPQPAAVAVKPPPTNSAKAPPPAPTTDPKKPGKSELQLQTE